MIGGIAVFLKVYMTPRLHAPLHMWFPILRSSSLHLLLMKATAGA